MIASMSDEKQNSPKGKKQITNSRKEINYFKFSIFGLLFLAAITASSYYLFSNFEISSYDSPITLPKNTSEIAKTKSLKQDLGLIPMSEGIKRIVFEYKNDSDEVINITKMFTTCMCTKAKLKIGQEETNFAGMQGHKSGLMPIDLRMSLEPGEKALISAEFDPNAHGPEATGPITRAIILETDNPDKPEIEFVFSGEVTP